MTAGMDAAMDGGMEADERRLLVETLAHKVRSAAPGGLRRAVGEFGWHDMLEAEPALAVSALAEMQGEYLTDTTLIDDMVLAGAVLAGATQAAGARVVYPRLGHDEPTSVVDGGTLALHGLVVAEGPDRLLVPALRKGRTVLVATSALPVAGIEKECAGIDPDSGWRLVAADVELSEDSEVTEGDDARERWVALRAAGQRALAHELVGVGRRMLTLALEHVSTREQFGKAIGSFQAVKHKMADVALHRECAELAAEAAWEDLRADSAQLAKIMAGRFVRTAAAECQQVLGGMGFTWEHDFHRYLRRGLLLEPVLGTAGTLRASLGRGIHADGVPRLAPL